MIATPVKRTAKEVRSAAKDTIISMLDMSVFDSMFIATPENLNWMLAVQSIDEGGMQTVAELKSILKLMNAHHKGPINIHEGWGGTEADSNADLISEKIKFDLRESFDMHNVQATIAAIEAGLVSASEYDEAIESNNTSFYIGSDELEADRMTAFFSHEYGNKVVIPTVSIYTYGKTEETRYRYCEVAIVKVSYAEFKNLTLTLQHFSDMQDKCAYVRFWVKCKNAPFRPY